MAKGKYLMWAFYCIWVGLGCIGCLINNWNPKILNPILTKEFPYLVFAGPLTLILVLGMILIDKTMTVSFVKWIEKISQKDTK